MMSRLLPAALAVACAAWAAGDRLVIQGSPGPGNGRRIVLVSGDEEYRSEQALPQLARVLADRHGFDCTVLFAIDPKDGAIQPDCASNIPGLETLDSADLLILFIRFRDLPDVQMRHFVEYVDSGRPIVALRTSTHAFDLKTSRTYQRYSWNIKEGGWEGGFGRQVLGETWIAHHGRHGVQSTRGVFAPGRSGHPILRGIRDGEIWVPTDVYRVRLPLPADFETLVLGQVLTGMDPADPPVAGAQNDPMMPVAWIRSGPRRVFTTTMGSAQDLLNEAFRRLLVNATYWALNMESRIDPQAGMELSRPYDPLPFGFGGFARGVRPADLEPRR